MRVLKSVEDGGWSLTKDLLISPAPYAILSHTWGTDEDEVNFEDIVKNLSVSKQGYTKLWFCANQARKDGLEYFWIDTCCIDRANLVELSEAITSMFRWYRQAAKCYVYLPDVSVDPESNQQDQWESSFRNSRWFTRGWTLQELLAPASVEFFSREGVCLGSKKTLEVLIHEITHIPINALRGQPLSHFPVDERLRWAMKRNTRKVEDKAYCLLGIFDISMSLRYGEGDKALARLEAKVKGPSKSAVPHELLKWLAPSRPQEFHAKASITRHPGTGSFFTDWALSSWLEDEPSHGSLMWISGKYLAGTGKTTLFSHVIEITKDFIRDTANQALAYHYCAFSDPESQQLINVLGSFVAQLSVWQPDLLKDVTEVFERDLARNQEKTLQVWELEKILVRYSGAFSTAILLIDALNESKDPAETFASIIRLLQLLPNLKILITSTTKALIAGIDQKINLTEVQMDPDEDIQTFVDFQLLNHNNLRHLSSDCKETVKSTLIDKADQSFRWVSLTIDNLGKQRTGKAVLKALAQAPVDLDQTYSQMLNMIPEADRPIAREALLWLSFAMRPLTLLEVSEAVILEDCDSILDEESRLHRPEVILDICYGLLEYDKNSGGVKLAHSSVKDYLVSGHDQATGDSFFHFKTSEGHRTITNRCLTYLLLDNFKSGGAFDSIEGFTRRQQFPFYEYAAHYWGQHASFATEEEWRLARQLFSTKDLPYGGNYGAWTSCLAPKVLPSTAVNTEPLYYAASFGMVPLVQALLSGSPTANMESPGGRHGSTALQVACFRGKKEAAECLLNAGADFWTADRGSRRPAWFWAQSNGWATMVDRMVQLRPSLAGKVHVEQQEARWARIVQEMMGVKV